MTQTDKIHFEDTLKKVRDTVLSIGNTHSGDMEREIVRSATKIYLYEKYHEEKKTVKD